MVKKILTVFTLTLLAGVAVSAQEAGVDSLAIAPEAVIVTAGDTVTFEATAYDADGLEIEAEITWSVDGGIGEIDENGLLTTTASGTGTVTAAVDTITAKSVVTVEEAAVTPDHIVITPDEPEVAVGDTVEFAVVVYDIDDNVLDEEVIWSVDGGIGDIDEDGVFVAETQGMGQVTAQAGDVSESVEIHVSAGQDGNGPTPAHLHIYPANATAEVGGTVQFEAAVTGPDDEEIEDAEVIWSVVDESIGTIDEDGLFTAAAAGVTEVIATVADLSDTATVTVVEEIPEIEGPTITVKRQFPDGSIKNFGGPIAAGDTLVLGGIPHPFNYLNSTRIFFPEGSISGDIVLMIKIPYIGHVKGNSVEFDGDILTAVTFDVLVDGEVVHPFVFDVPVEVTLPYKYGLLKKMGVDPATLDMYYVNEDGQLYSAGIEDTEMDEDQEGITAKVAHFSDLALASTSLPTVVNAAPAPASFTLDANYPNPFNPETVIAYSLEAAGDIRLDIYNIAGQHIRTLANGMQAAGSHSVVWDGTDARGNHVTSGVYIYRLTAGGFTQARKLMLMK